MLKYEIHYTSDGCVIQVNAKDLDKWALHDSYDTPLVWSVAGNQALAATTHDILVYRKPYGIQWHNAVITHNSRALHIGSSLFRYNTMHRDVRPEFDRLQRDMYEYKGIIPVKVLA